MKHSVESSRSSSGPRILILALALITVSCGEDVRPHTVRAAAGEAHAVIAAPLAGPTGVEISTPGGPERVPCGTCHRSRESNRKTRSTEELDEFHQGLEYAHLVTCVSCHGAGDYDSLVLADGTSVEYENATQLCRQCHGPQARAYDHGAHGGWNGFWDLTRGPRERNQCLHCHDPHSPAFPHMHPTFKPRDRFLTPSHAESHEKGGQS